MNKLKALSGNSKLVLANTVKSFGVKGCSILIAFFTTPAYMRFFQNNEVLGIWFTLLSVLAWILNCDLGIGNGLRDKLVYCIQENDWDMVRKYISSSYVFLCGVGLAAFCIVEVCGCFVSWNKVFNISTEVLSAEVLNKAIQILLASIIIQFVLRLVTSILYSLQEAFVPGLLGLITNVVMLAAVLICNSAGAGNSFILLAWVYLVAVNLPLLLATFWVFHKKLKHVRPSLRAFRMQYALNILKIGGIFLLLQIVSMIVDNTNSYLITLFVGNAEVVEYQIYYKIFSLPITLVMIFATALWSTITKAKAEEDWNWLTSIFNKLMLLCLGVAVLEFALIFPLQIIFNIWLGNNTIPVNVWIAAFFALSGAIMGWRTIVAGVANGLCRLKEQAIYMTIGAAVNIPIAYWLVGYLHSYVAIIIANIISMIPYCIVQTISCRHYLSRQGSRKVNNSF